MVHKQQYQMLADQAARAKGCYALHIGKIGDETFVYSLRKPDSRDFDPDNQTVVTVCGDTVAEYTGPQALEIIAEATPREFSTGRAIYKKYETLVKNGSFVIGESLDYAKAIVNAVKSKAVKAATLYQYLEIADHNRLKINIEKDANGNEYFILHS